MGCLTVFAAPTGQALTAGTYDGATDPNYGNNVTTDTTTVVTLKKV
ncbi:hypothetical protein [Kutzneria sp. CA-103260]|nr:hypothetical protein [Kutzneria sp. CA-103260]QUQ70156.1 hypothetical protein JJ691_79300 [Kutzneria sp. CA-103260]